MGPLTLMTQSYGLPCDSKEYYMLSFYTTLAIELFGRRPVKLFKMHTRVVHEWYQGP